MKASMENPAIKESNNKDPSMVPNLKNLMKLTFGFSSILTQNLIGQNIFYIFLLFFFKNKTFLLIGQNDHLM
jgi:hypothetical protein